MHRGPSSPFKYLIKHARDADGGKEDDFEDDGGQKLDEEWIGEDARGCFDRARPPVLDADMRRTYLGRGTWTVSRHRDLKGQMSGKLILKQSRRQVKVDRKEEAM